MIGRQRRVGAWALAALVVAFPAGLVLGARLAESGASSNEGDPGAGPDLEWPVSGADDRFGARPEAGSAALAATRPDDAGVRAVAGSAPLTVQEVPAVSPAGSRRRTPIVEAASRVAPSVVSITVLKTVRATGPRSLFEDFWNLVPRQFERTVRGLGSGFAIDAEGLILTNEHVVGGADSIVVSDSEGRVFRAELVGADGLTDIAVLKIAPGRVPPAPLGSSADLVVGEPAIAIGNPFGYLIANAEATVTSGVISGVGRDIISAEEGQTLLADMVQTDASINPGNSGGPLVNADGQVVGINSSIFSRSGGSEGLGFAIPIDRALRIADELRRFGRIRRPYVGVDAVAVQSDTSLFSETQVRRVAPDSPAEKAGLRQGDVLMAISGRPINSPLDWEVGLLDAGVASDVEVTFSRGGRVRRTSVRVVELPSERAERLEVITGLELITVTPQIAVERQLPVEAGALIVGISARNSRATGMREDDVIVAINRRRVETARDADDLFQYYARRGRIWVRAYRDGRYYDTTFYVR